VPAGTRNHLALDLGVDRDDVVGALDAFGEAREARVDLATVNGQVFVNNVCLGVYAEIVRSDAYRDAKAQTVSSMLPALMGHHAAPFDLRIDGPDGRRLEGVQIVLVSNGPYQLDQLGGMGTRARLDSGTLGIAALHVGGPADVTTFVALEAAGQVRRFGGWREWTAPSLTIGSGASLAAGIDGESIALDPPLQFASRPGALRVRTAVHHPGVSPAAIRPAIGRSTFAGLARVVRGRPSGLID
jgi:diacylglycerol kinase family enzyme